MVDSRTRLFRIALAVAFIAVSSVACAQQLSIPPPAPTSTDPQIAELQRQNAVLEAQLEEMRRQDTRLLQVVVGVLGIEMLVFGAMLTLGWYANFRVYRKDLDVAKSEVRTEALEQINERARAIEKGIMIALNELESAVGNKLTTVREDLTELSRGLSAEIHDKNEERKEESKKHLSAMTTIVTKFNKESNEFIKLLMHADYYTRYKIADIQAWRWGEQKLHGLVLSALIDKLEAVQKLGWNTSIPEILREISKTLDSKRTDDNASFFRAFFPDNPERQVEIAKALDQVPRTYWSELEPIYSKLGVLRERPALLAQLSRIGPPIDAVRAPAADDSEPES